MLLQLYAGKGRNALQPSTPGSCMPYIRSVTGLAVAAGQPGEGWEAGVGLDAQSHCFSQICGLTSLQ